MQKPYIDIKKFIPQVYAVLFYYAMLVNRKYNEFVIKGGRASLKSTVAAIIVILTVYLDIGNAVCIRRYRKDLRVSCRNTIIENLKRLGLDSYFTWSDAPNGILQMKCILNGRTIEFEGLDDPDKLKSYAEAGGVGVVWFEECQMIESMKKIDNVMQTFDRGANNVIFVLCYNPKPLKRHWCNTELTVSADNRFILHTTYLDVIDWVGKNVIKRADKLKQRNFEQFQNEYMGEIIGSKGKVFRQVRDISKEAIHQIAVKKDITNHVYYKQGLDFGFAEKGDPCAYTKWRLVKEGDETNLYCIEEYGGNALKIEVLAAEIKKRNKFNLRILCDHHTLAIGQLTGKPHNLNLELAHKHNMREEGFQKLANDIDNIYICEELTPETYNEFTEYTYAETKDGSTDYSQYPKHNDHFIDSCRYALSEWFRGNESIDILSR